jgi:hypothetical protein
MNFRLLLLTCACAGVLLMNPAGRSTPLPVSASVVWGACTSWTGSHRIPPGALPASRDGTYRLGRVSRE